MPGSAPEGSDRPAIAYPEDPSTTSAHCFVLCPLRSEVRPEPAHSVCPVLVDHRWAQDWFAASPSTPLLWSPPSDREMLSSRAPGLSWSTLASHRTSFPAADLGAISSTIIAQHPVSRAALPV